MVAAELRGGNQPNLNEALGWIGSRVDDIYGANVGRLEDVWIDPGTGVPRWLLVKEGRFGGRTTLVPFEDATAGTGHVWVPYEREIVRGAPEIEPGAPLTQQVESSLRTHYAASTPVAISHRGTAGSEDQPSREPDIPQTTLRFTRPEPEQAAAPPAQQPRFATPPDDVGQGSPQEETYGFDDPGTAYPAQPSERPEPPMAAAQPARYQPPQQQPQSQQPKPSVDPSTRWMADAPPPPTPQQQQPAAQSHSIDSLQALADSGGSHYVEIELSGELTIRGELRSIRVTPPDQTKPPPR